MMQKNLTGRKAIITGANQGLGFEISKKYVQAGADVMLCARSVTLLDEARAELETMATTKGQKILATVADVSAEADVHVLVAKTLKELGGCHILVNNAGIYGPRVRSNWWTGPSGSRR